MALVTMGLPDLWSIFLATVLIRSQILRLRIPLLQEPHLAHRRGWRPEGRKEGRQGMHGWVDATADMIGPRAPSRDFFAFRREILRFS